MLDVARSALTVGTADVVTLPFADGDSGLEAPVGEVAAAIITWTELVRKREGLAEGRAVCEA